jgi:hypothetical protein
MINDPKPIRLPKEDLKDFRISFDIMVRHDIGSLPRWKEHPAVLAMVAMLKVKDIVELFAEVIKNEPAVEKDMVELRKQLALATDTSTDRETREKVRKEIKDYLEEGLFWDCGNEPNQLYYIYAYRPFGVNLNQPVDVSPDNPSYPLLFAFRLSKTYYPGEFLQHHLSKTFQGDTGAYKLFLAQLDKAMLGSRNDFLIEWIAQKLRLSRKKQQNDPTTRNDPSPKKVKGSLDEYFKDPVKATSMLRAFCGTSSLRTEIAAMTLKHLIKERYKKNIKGPEISSLLGEIGILLGDDLGKFSEKFRRLTNEPDSKLFKDLETFV